MRSKPPPPSYLESTPLGLHDASFPATCLFAAYLVTNTHLLFWDRNVAQGKLVLHVYTNFFATMEKTCLLVPRIKNHLSSFELGFLNIFSGQNLLCSLSFVLFLLQRYKYGLKNSNKPCTFDSTSEMIRL